MPNIVDGVRFPDKTILVLPYELVRALGGNPMAVRTDDGEAVTLRLYTAQEFYDHQHALTADGTGEPVSWDRAVELTKPLQA